MTKLEKTLTFRKREFDFTLYSLREQELLREMKELKELHHLERELFLELESAISPFDLSTALEDLVKRKRLGIKLLLRYNHVIKTHKHLLNNIKKRGRKRHKSKYEDTEV